MNNDPVLRMIGLSMRAGKLVFGSNLVVSAIRSPNKPKLVLIAEDASDNTKKKVIDGCTFHSVKYLNTQYSGSVFSKTIGKTFDVMVVAVTDDGLAKTIINKINDPGVAESGITAGGAII